MRQLHIFLCCIARFTHIETIAINKPQSLSSAGVLRDLDTHFADASLFRPWLQHEQRKLVETNAKPKSIANLKVKLGHGGTLDPLATGVLVVGVGKGTKCLSRFLECTKSYECVILFGAATDSYDCLGKVVGRAPYEHVTKELVESALQKFRGKIMQKPSIFSALKVDGKKMYEYARAGGHVPEVKAREVEVEELEMLEWLEPRTHDYTWPTEEVNKEEMEGAKTLINVEAGKEDAQENGKGSSLKRNRAEDDDAVRISNTPSKKRKTGEDLVMSGALPADEPTDAVETKTATEVTEGTEAEHESETTPDTTSKPSPPAARLRMTVTSGFYVRSLCHDLGLACNSLGLMSALVRTRQGAYTLGENVLEFSDLEKGESVWGPQIQKSLEDFMKKEGWEPVTVPTDEDYEKDHPGFFKKKEKAMANAQRGRENGRGRGRDGRGRGGRNGRDQGEKKRSA